MSEKVTLYTNIMISNSILIAPATSLKLQRCQMLLGTRICLIRHCLKLACVCLLFQNLNFWCTSNMVTPATNIDRRDCRLLSDIYMYFMRSESKSARAGSNFQELLHMRVVSLLLSLCASDEDRSPLMPVSILCSKALNMASDRPGIFQDFITSCMRPISYYPFPVPA